MSGEKKGSCCLLGQMQSYFLQIVVEEVQYDGIIFNIDCSSPFEKLLKHLVAGHNQLGLLRRRSAGKKPNYYFNCRLIFGVFSSAITK